MSNKFKLKSKHESLNEKVFKYFTFVNQLYEY